jgi:hypothetical protein
MEGGERPLVPVERGPHEPADARRVTRCRPEMVGDAEDALVIRGLAVASLDAVLVHLDEPALRNLQPDCASSEDEDLVPWRRPPAVVVGESARLGFRTAHGRVREGQGVRRSFAGPGDASRSAAKLRRAFGAMAPPLLALGARVRSGACSQENSPLRSTSMFGAAARRSLPG